MRHTISLIALLVSSSLGTTFAAENAPANTPAQSPNPIPEVAPAAPQLNVNFPDVQKQINADLDRIQRQAQGVQTMQDGLVEQAYTNGSTQPTNDPVQANAQAQFNGAAKANGQVYGSANAASSAATPPVPPTPPTPRPTPTTSTANPQNPTVTMLPPTSNQEWQPVAMVKMADGSVYPVYVAPGQHFDPNIQHGPEQATAYLTVPVDKLQGNGTLTPIGQPQNAAPQASQANTPATYQGQASNVTQATNITQGTHTTPTNNTGVDPAYAPKVKVFGNKTPTMVGTREEVRNYVNTLQQNGTYDYNVNAGYDPYAAATNEYYNNYYNNYGSYTYDPYYDPYYGQVGRLSYYQDADGKWHKILGFRFDNSINNYVPIYAGMGSCVGPDCPVIYDPDHPYAGLPQPNPNPQGPAIGQPPTWGPPPSYRPGTGTTPPSGGYDPVDPGFTYPNRPNYRPNYRPNTPPQYHPYPGRPGTPSRPNRPVPQDPVDPGFTHPLG